MKLIIFLQVGGLISLNIHGPNTTSSFSLAFTESPTFVRPLYSDDSSLSNPNQTYDGSLKIASPLPNGYWTQPPEWLRGGFRYLTILSTSDAPITLSNVSCDISFMPHWPDLRAYTGYFYAKDPGFHDPDFLTKCMCAMCP